MRPALLAAISIVLLVGLPSLSIPQAIAPSHPEIAVRGGVHGHVLSDVGGPLGGALVIARGDDGREWSALTDSDGSYILELPAGSWWLNASARGHDARAAEVVVLSSQMPAEQNFTLEHNGPVLRGTVRDAKSGAALGQVTIEAHGGGFDCKPDQPCPLAAEGDARMMPEFYRMPLSTRTGADGKYAIALDGEGSWNVRAWRDGYREAWQGVEVGGDRTLDLRLEAFPPKNAVVEGRVVDAKTGAPVAGAWVNAYPNYYRTGTATPEASGGGASGSPGSASSTVAPSPPIVCDDADCPAPEPCCPYEGNSTQTGRDGRYRMAMYPGEYTLNVGAEKYGQHQQALTLGDGEREVADVELRPIPGDTVTVRGTVLDKATGRPVAYAWVSVENQEWGHYAGDQADANGRFELRTKPGWTLLWVRVDQGGYAVPATAQADAPVGSEGNTSSASPSGIRAPDSPPQEYRQPEGSYYPWVRGFAFADGATQDVRAELQPKPKADVKLVGYVLNATSKQPLAGATVNVRNEDTGDWGYAQADDDGSFVILARPGWHTVQAYADGHFANAVVVEVEAPQTRVDLPLQPGRSQGYCCIAYAERGVAMDAGTTAPGASGAPGAPGAAPQPPVSGEASQSAASSQNLRGEGAATYQATGEGLGPYNAASAPPPGEARVGGQQVPGPSAVLALAGLGAAALVLARRRK